MRRKLARRGGGAVGAGAVAADARAAAGGGLAGARCGAAAVVGDAAGACAHAAAIARTLASASRSTSASVVATGDGGSATRPRSIAGRGKTGAALPSRMSGVPSASGRPGRAGGGAAVVVVVAVAAASVRSQPSTHSAARTRASCLVWAAASPLSALAAIARCSWPRSVSPTKPATLPTPSWTKPRTPSA